jgi:hypothetical protein
MILIQLISGLVGLVIHLSAPPPPPAAPPPPPPAVEQGMPQHSGFTLSPFGTVPQSDQ